MKNIKSLLFVPAEERKLNKITQTNADAFIIDLEDSIGADYKDKALETTIQFLNCHKTNNIFVRINHHRYKAELEALRQFNVGFMLPKIESDTDYSETDVIQHNRKIIVLIETPRALINVNEIAAIPWVTALAFGAEDFTVNTNILNSVNTLSVPKTMIVLAAKANKKRVYDTPCFQLKDESFLNSELQQAVSLGFDGKLAIHPKQVEVINQAFLLSDPMYMQYIINAYETSGNAVCEIDGRVFEKLHIDKIRRKLIRGVKGKED